MLAASSLLRGLGRCRFRLPDARRSFDSARWASRPPERGRDAWFDVSAHVSVVREKFRA